MRISDDRYRRDRRAFDLAWRLLGHDARTGTISRWTGLGERRIRTLQRSYRNENGAPTSRRPRGRTPYRIELLLRSSRRRDEVTEFARMLQEAGFIPREPIRDADDRLPSIERGELLCDIFERYTQLFPKTTISIEHAVLVVLALVRREEVELGYCVSCQRLMLIDRLAARPMQCTSCDRKTYDASALAAPRGTQASTAGAHRRR